jgi:hypothetical protein
MKLEVILFLIIGFLIYDTYYGKNYIKYIYGLKKHAKTFAIIFGVFSVYLMIKKDPSQAKKMLFNANNMVRFLPMDRNGFGSNFGGDGEISGMFPSIGGLGSFNLDGTDPSSVNRILSSGKGATKRSVSETKKKYVASQQDWMCGNCGRKLNAWFEVDHKTRLEYGGSNEVSNLVALCRECHGEKTAMENM